MQNLENTAAEGRVSYADLIALGGAYAVSVTGGPVIDVPIGRSTCFLLQLVMLTCECCFSQPSSYQKLVGQEEPMAMSCLAGRKDAIAADPANRLPEETLSAEALRLSFEAKGLSAQELVALSGAHTVS